MTMATLARVQCQPVSDTPSQTAGAEPPLVRLTMATQKVSADDASSSVAAAAGGAVADVAGPPVYYGMARTNGRFGKHIVAYGIGEYDKMDQHGTAQRIDANAASSGTN